MNRSLIIFLAVVYVSSHGQSRMFSSLIDTTDSIVVANTNREFFNHLLDKRDTSRIVLTYPPDETILMVSYDFAPFYSDYYLIKDNGLRGLGFTIMFNTKRREFTLPDFKLLVRAFNAIKSTSILGEKTATEFARPHFLEGTRDSHRKQVAYQNDIDKLTWRITRKKGFMAVKEVTVVLDAETGDFIGREELVVHRTFVQTIGDWFSGFY